MAIRDDLLYQENILTKEELAQILNPFDEEILNKYGNDINLSGYTKVVEQFINKINSFIQYNNCDKFNKNYKEVVEEQKIVRFRKKVSDNEYIDCLADSDGAEPYEYTYKKIKYVEDKQGKDNINLTFTDKELPQELSSFNKIDVTELVNNFEKLKYLLYNEKVITKKVALNLIDDILKSINVAREETKNWWLNKKFYDKQKHLQELPTIKQQYIELYNLYEELKSKQSLGIVKANRTNGKEIEMGL